MLRDMGGLPSPSSAGSASPLTGYCVARRYRRRRTRGCRGAVSAASDSASSGSDACAASGVIWGTHGLPARRGRARLPPLHTNIHTHTRTSLPTVVGESDWKDSGGRGDRSQMFCMPLGPCAASMSTHGTDTVVPVRRAPPLPLASGRRAPWGAGTASGGRRDGRPDGGLVLTGAVGMAPSSALASSVVSTTQSAPSSSKNATSAASNERKPPVRPCGTPRGQQMSVQGGTTVSAHTHLVLHSTLVADVLLFELFRHAQRSLRL